jgi:hypothetical protein
MRRREAERGRAGHILAGETERLVADLLPITIARPADIKAHVRWGRRRRLPAEADRDEEAVVVGDRNVLGVDARPANTGVNIDRRRCDRNHPEQPRRPATPPSATALRCNTCRRENLAAAASPSDT